MDTKTSIFALGWEGWVECTRVIGEREEQEVWFGDNKEEKQQKDKGKALITGSE